MTGSAEPAAPSGPVYEDRINPAKLRKQVEVIRGRAPGGEAAVDRRGFALLHWPSTVGNRKPIELSREHEVLLAPESPSALGGLVTALHTSEGQACGQYLLPSLSPARTWTLRRYERAPGPQSVDVFFDVDADELPLTSAGYTLRVRSHYSPFMTWDAGSDGTYAVNAELPAQDLNRRGLIVRNEFNWLAPTEPPRGGAPVGPPVALAGVDPLDLLAEVIGFPLAGLVPISEHRTVRMKFALTEPNAAAEERLIVNIDYVVARQYADGQRVRWVDVDASTPRPINVDELDLLEQFGVEFADNYGLMSRPTTKVARATQLFS